MSAQTRARLVWWAEYAALLWLLWPVTAVELLLAVLAAHVVAAFTPPPKARYVLPSKPQARGATRAHTEGREHDSPVHP